MDRIKRFWLGAVLICLIGGLVVAGVYFSDRINNQTEVSIESAEQDVWAKRQSVDMVGVAFEVPAEWVVIKDSKDTQCVLYRTLGEYNDTRCYNEIRVCTSWVEKNFDIKDFADSWYLSLKDSASVASTTRDIFTINGVEIQQVGVIDNGVFCGYEYFLRDNVIVEVRYMTSDRDLLSEFENYVSRLISTVTWDTGVKEEDFPLEQEDEGSINSDNAVVSENTTTELQE